MEKIAELQDFALEIQKKESLELPKRRIDIANSLINFSPEKMEKIHLAEWYADFWKFASLTMITHQIAPEENDFVQKILQDYEHENNPLKRLYLALALLIFGNPTKISESGGPSSNWSKQLTEDYLNFAKWSHLVNDGPDIRGKAMIKRSEKILDVLREKYSDLIKKYSAIGTKEKFPQVPQKKYQIYFCWLQGEENLPPLVQCCYNSLKKNAGDYKIQFIDEKNFSDLIELPEHILKKFEEGKITRTHFSDIIRVNLLEKYGGLWLDSTILVTEPLEHYKRFWKMPYFTQKFIHERTNTHPIVKAFGCYNNSYARWAGYIQGTSILHNPLFSFEREFFNEYWKDFDEVIDYVLMDFMMEIAYDAIPFVRKEMDDVPINNVNVWTLLGRLNLKYSEFPYDKIIKDTFLNKLSWKKKDLDMTAEDTVFAEIKRRFL